MKLSWLKLAWIATVCVIKTMREGHKRYPNELWLKQNLQTHAQHARGHAAVFINEYGQSDEDDIAHMITRGAMIKYLEGK